MRLLLAFLMAAWGIGLVMAVTWGVPRVEDGLRRQVQGVLREAGLVDVTVEVHERAVWLHGEAHGQPEAEWVKALAASVDGVRRVHAESLTVIEPRPPLFPPDGPPPTPEEVRDALNGLIQGEVDFQAGSAILQPDGEVCLDEVAQVLVEQAGVRLFVEGHTDNQGSGDDNLALSRRRAETVVKRLVAGGVEPERLHALGYGGSKPIADNDTEEGRAQNRRIAFRLRTVQGDP